MQKLPVPLNSAMRRRKFLVGSLSGLFLDVILIAFLFLDGFYLWLDPIRWMICALLFYLLAPILPSIYIAQQTGDAWEGQQAGLLTGITGMVLAILAAGIFLWIITLGNSGHFIPPSLIFVSAAVLNIFGFLVSIPGAIIGGKLGTAWRKRTFVS